MIHPSTVRAGEELSRLFETLRKTTEARTVAIACCAYLEDFLEESLAVTMPNLNSDLRTRLFDNGALSPIAVKIDLAKAHGIIDGESLRLMRAIASIRNRFAHTIAVDSFDHPAVSGIMDDKMKLSAGFQKAYDEAFILDEKEAASESRRERFEGIAMLLCVQLHNHLNHVHQQLSGGIARLVTFQRGPNGKSG